MSRPASVFGLFPTPLMHAPACLDAPLVAALLARLDGAEQTVNSHSGQLSHSRILTPAADALLVRASMQVMPHLAAFGALLFGESLDWSIKEIWANFLQAGGQQTMHNHANCFISGVLYLSAVDASAGTVFTKGPGGRDYVFGNSGERVSLNAFNADKWVVPEVAPGDLVLFPSYLLHEVPPNRGGLRITLAFNAIPSRLESWGYGISLSA
jgi:uncharacterized protein (TIGR02466 family)